MKAAASLLLLFSSLLLSSHLHQASSRPHPLPAWPEDGGRPLGAQVLLRAADLQDAEDHGDLLKLLLLLRRRNHTQQEEEQQQEEEEEELRTAAAQLLKRSAEPPPLSIDMPYHLMRNMLEIARMEKIAQDNRDRFDEVGK